MARMLAKDWLKLNELGGDLHTIAGFGDGIDDEEAIEASQRFVDALYRHGANRVRVMDNRYSTNKCFIDLQGENGRVFSSSDVMGLIKTIGDTRPDEVGIVGNEIRLWWY